MLENKSGAEIYQVSFRYPIHLKYIVVNMCEQSIQFLDSHDRKDYKK